MFLKILYLFAYNECIWSLSWESHNSLDSVLARTLHSSSWPRPVRGFPNIYPFSVTEDQNRQSDVRIPGCLSSGCRINSRKSHTGSLMFLFQKDGHYFDSHYVDKPLHLLSGVKEIWYTQRSRIWWNLTTSIIGPKRRKFVKSSVSYRYLGNILLKLMAKDITKAKIQWIYYIHI